jgi:hypothetical protein
VFGQRDLSLVPFFGWRSRNTKVRSKLEGEENVKRALITAKLSPGTDHDPTMRLMSDREAEILCVSAHISVFFMLSGFPKRLL